MKARFSLALGLLLIASAASAARPQVEITARYEDFDPAFFSEPPEGLPPGVLSTPRVKTASGQKATIEITKEFPVASFTEPERKVSGGLTLELEPEIKGGKIFLSGKSTVRRPEVPAAAQPLAASSFTARETFFSGEIEDGKAIAIQTGDGVKDTSRVILTARLLLPEDAKPARTTAPNYSVWSVELPAADAADALAKALGTKTPALPPPGKEAELVGVLDSPQLAAVFRGLLAGKSLKRLPVGDWPIVLGATLGPDTETVDLSIRLPAEQSPTPLLSCTIWCDSSLWMTVADAKQTGGRRVLLIVPE